MDATRISVLRWSSRSSEGSHPPRDEEELGPSPKRSCKTGDHTRCPPSSVDAFHIPSAFAAGTHAPFLPEGSAPPLPGGSEGHITETPSPVNASKVGLMMRTHL